jgi:hypothetical protein
MDAAKQFVNRLGGRERLLRHLGQVEQVLRTANPAKINLPLELRKRSQSSFSPAPGRSRTKSLWVEPELLLGAASACSASPEWWGAGE